MTTVALLGAGGKMGLRLAANLRTDHELHCIETGEAGRGRLRDAGLERSGEEALGTADAVIFALPDTLLEELSARYVPAMRPGALAVLLDPACPYAGLIHRRDDVDYAVAHPCHPGVFNWEASEDAFRDFYGGVSAEQGVLLAMVQGDGEARRRAEALARAMYAPVGSLHEVTLEQMAILEPALVETLAQTCMEAVRRGYDRVVELGVPADAARDFVLGHLRIQIAVLFGEVEGGFSDAAYRISERSWPRLFQEDWQQVFELDDVREQIATIVAR